MSQIFQYDTPDYEEIIWEGSKCNLLGLPFTFTSYFLTENELTVSTGFFYNQTKPIFVSSMKTLKHTQTLWQRIIGTGTVMIDTSEDSAILIENIKESYDVYNEIKKQINLWRIKHTIHISDHSH